ncbi:MAG: response regulator, partial [Treponema sp.]|nr:response regulator [Treponema sp.]
MKQVLIIDASPIFRDFIKSKLDTENVGVEFANGHRDGVTKLLSILPDLVILDINNSIQDLEEFLEKKKNDINAKRIPMIVCGPVMNKDEVAELVQYGVFKYFSKPIKFDVFFESIGKILKLDFSMDITPCVLDIHLNGKLIFIEIAMGLNREKIMLIRYKLSELIDKTGIKDPKLILMMTDLDLSFIDGTNLELLFSNIIADSRIRRRNIKVLSMSQIVKDLIDGHPEYNGIEVASSLSAVLGSLMGPESKPSSGNEMQNLISDKILTSTMDVDDGMVGTRFSFDEQSDKKDGGLFKAAILDDDQVVKTMLTAA